MRESNGENSSGSKGGKFCIIVNIVNNSGKKILGNGYCYTNIWAANYQNLVFVGSDFVLSYVGLN